MSREYRNFCAKFGELMRWKKGQEQGSTTEEWDDRSDNPLVETQFRDGTVVWDFRDPVDPNDLIANIPPWQKNQVERLSAAMEAGRTITMHPDGRFEFGPREDEEAGKPEVTQPYDWAEEDEEEGVEDMAKDIDRKLEEGWEPSSRPVEEVVDELRAKYDNQNLTVARTISINYTLPPMAIEGAGLVERDWDRVEELIFDTAVEVVEKLGGVVESAGSGPTEDEVRGLEEEG